jgi:hypothetical protein
MDLNEFEHGTTKILKNFLNKYIILKSCAMIKQVSQIFTRYYNHKLVLSQNNLNILLRVLADLNFKELNMYTIKQNKDTFSL